MTVLEAQGLTEKNIIESVLNSHYIVDYGYINKLNADGTVNVTHAVLVTMQDGTVLDETVTKNVEVLTIAGAGFSINFDYKEGDKVLLLGLKDYVPSVEAVEKAEKPAAFLHYRRQTMKCIPMCIFNSDAEVKVNVKEGGVTLEAKKDLVISAKNEKVTADKIELNGNSKQFVTWTELNTALQNLVTALNTHTHPAPGGATSAPAVALTLDISGAKTSSVVTGG